MLRAVLGTAAAVLLAAVPARAGSLPGGVAPTLQLDVESSTSAYDYHAQQTGSLDPSGETYSMVGSGNGAGYSVSWDLDVDADPFIAGTVNLTNLSNTTEEFVLTLTLPAVPMPGANRIGGSFGVVTFSDANGDGSVTLSSVGASPFYQALTDGSAFAPLGSLGSFSLNAFGGSGAVGTVSQHAFGSPIPSAPAPAVAGSIGLVLHFQLSGGDRVQIPVRLEVAAPEPAALALLGLGLAALVLRRALP